MRYRTIREHLKFRIGMLPDQSNTWVLMFPAHKIAYIPIPKAANSSIRAELLRLIDIDPADIPLVQEFEGFDKRRFSDCPELFSKDWYAFTVVRNPFSRIASAYLDKVVTGDEVLSPLRRMGTKKDDTFSKFLSLIMQWPERRLNNHVMPASLLLEGTLKLPALDVHKVETLAETWPKIAQTMTARTGIEFEPLGRRNASKASKPWQSLYDAKTEAMVRHIYKNDFSRFYYPQTV